ncbi:MAG: ATP-binding protein [Elusimicrobiota bacterium]
MKYRILAKTIIKALKSFPVVVVTGPRQSGKTTLLKNIFKDTHAYVNLEDPDTRIRAKEDPRGFLEQHKPPVIFDEIQYIPELLPYIKTKIDENRKPGQWILTGSQNFVLTHNVSESLAGRAAILSLLPFSFSERFGLGESAVDTNSLLKILPARRQINLRNDSQSDKKISLATLLLRGNYPEIASKSSIDRQLWCGSYIITYIERDIRNLSHVGDMNQFERFLRLCATMTGQILNVSELARDIGVSVPTAKRWISLLETGYQIYLLYPYYKNLGKRLIKSPKIYFNDTALACYLMGLNDPNSLLNSSHFPHIFETFIVIDFWKRFLNFGEMPSLYYLRTLDGLEIDLVIEIKQKLHLFEIKSVATIIPKHASSLLRAKRDIGNIVRSSDIISLSPKSFYLPKGINNYTWQDILSL